MARYWNDYSNEDFIADYKEQAASSFIDMVICDPEYYLNTVSKTEAFFDGLAEYFEGDCSRAEITKHFNTWLANELCKPEVEKELTKELEKIGWRDALIKELEPLLDICNIRQLAFEDADCGAGYDDVISNYNDDREPFAYFDDHIFGFLYDYLYNKGLI